MHIFNAQPHCILNYHNAIRFYYKPLSVAFSYVRLSYTSLIIMNRMCNEPFTISQLITWRAVRIARHHQLVTWFNVQKRLR
jgi:hypothetical protein